MAWCTHGLVYSWCTHGVLMVTHGVLMVTHGVLMVYSWCTHCVGTHGVLIVACRYSWCTHCVLRLCLWFDKDLHKLRPCNVTSLQSVADQ